MPPTVGPIFVLRMDKNGYRAGTYMFAEEGPWAGWVFRMHYDGHWVSITQMKLWYHSWLGQLWTVCDRHQCFWGSHI